MARIKVTLREERYMFLIISRSFLLKMKTMSDKSCRENQNMHFVFNIFFFFLFFETRTFYEMWKQSVERGRPQKAIGRMRIACWKTKATNKPSEYVTLMDFPLQHL